MDAAERLDELFKSTAALMNDLVARMDDAKTIWSETGQIPPGYRADMDQAKESLTEILVLVSGVSQPQSSEWLNKIKVDVAESIGILTAVERVINTADVLRPPEQG